MQELMRRQRLATRQLDDVERQGSFATRHDNGWYIRCQHRPGTAAQRYDMRCPDTSFWPRQMVSQSAKDRMHAPGASICAAACDQSMSASLFSILAAYVAGPVCGCVTAVPALTASSTSSSAPAPSSREALMQTRRRFLRLDANRPARINRPGIQSALHVHDRNLPLGITGEQCALDRRRTSPAWQEEA